MLKQGGSEPYTQAGLLTFTMFLEKRKGTDKAFIRLTSPYVLKSID